MYTHAISFSFVCVATLLTGASSAQVGSSARLLRNNQQRDNDLGGGASAALKPGVPGLKPTLSSVSQILSKFRSEAVRNRQGLSERHAAEEARLNASMAETQNSDVQLALSQSVTSNTEAQLETDRVYENMLKFADSMAGLLGSARVEGSNCQHLSCGEHSSCTETPTGAQCMCKEGYVGKGSDCFPPPDFMPHRVLSESDTSTVAAADVHVAVLESNKIGIVYRDASKANAGMLVVGIVRDSGRADLGPPEGFTVDQAAAYDPVIAGAGPGKVVIAWRDQHRQGTGFVRGGTVGASGIRGAELFVQLGSPVAISKSQAQKMAMAPLPGSRVALMFNDEASAGTAALISIENHGSVALQGNFRFMDSPVSRMEVTKVRPNAFVLAARAQPYLPDDELATVSMPIKQEALAIYGELVDNDLVFDPNVMSLEPNQTGIWARGVSLIAPDTVAYAYQEGNDLKIKMAVLEINPKTHRMVVAAGPQHVHTGFSHYVSMLSMPYTASDPHTLVYFQDSESSASKVNVCSWTASHGKLEKCEDFVWLPHNLSSVSGVHLAGGRSLMVFTTEAQQLYYTVFGLTKK